MRNTGSDQQFSWQSAQAIPSKQFDCGYCGSHVASQLGLRVGNGGSRVCICPHCSAPTILLDIDGGKQYPGVAPGSDVEHVPQSLNALYSEARTCCSVNAFTSSVLACRKLLMNIAVQLGAGEGLKFIEYVEYLSDKNYVPPNGKGWVDHIRKKGNEATHEIKLMQRADAEELISFAEMLLKFIYEFPAKVPGAAPP